MRASTQGPLPHPRREMATKEKGRGDGKSKGENRKKGEKRGARIVAERRDGTQQGSRNVLSFFFLHSRKRAYMRNRDAALLADLQERKQRKVRDAKSPPKEEYTLVCLCLT